MKIGDSTKNRLLQLATLLNTNQIKNDVINNQETQQSILAATININNPKITPSHTTTNNNSNLISFHQDIKLLQSAFLKLTKSFILFKQKK